MRGISALSEKGAEMAKKKSSVKKRDPRRATQKRGSRTHSKQSSRSSAPSSSSTGRTGEQRLQRVLAAAGVGSRRECETLIEEGRVEVDGQFITKLGVKVDPAKCKIRVDGTQIKLQRLQYFAVNKPPGVVSTSSDPSGRLRVIDLIKTSQRVYNVGRLDKSSEGLILVTNDGDLANRLTHPRYGVQKTYLVQVVGQPTGSDLKKLERGVYLAEGLAKVVGARIKSRTKDHPMLEIVLEEGRNREIRRLLASIGHKVIRLRRVAIGTLRLADLPLGAHRPLEKQEIAALKRVAENPGATKSGRKRTGKKPAKKPTKRPTKNTSGKSKPTSEKSKSETFQDSPFRKRKPKVGEEGWTIKSGGKPRKKKYTKKQLAEMKAERQKKIEEERSEKPSRRTGSTKKKSRTSKTKFAKGKTSKSRTSKGKSRKSSKAPSQGRGQARAAAKTTAGKSKRSTKKSGKKSVARGKGKRKSTNSSKRSR